MHRYIRYSERLCLRWRSGARALLKNANHRPGCNIAKRHSSTGHFGPIDLPEQARVVICGGGVVGTSLAYHLTLLGWSDVVLLEQGRYAPILGLTSLVFMSLTRFPSKSPPFQLHMRLENLVNRVRMLRDLYNLLLLELKIYVTC